MKITIIGWYGTETIGDRAILAGILSFLSKSYGSFEINLGSLYPFFTQRTIQEDTSLWQKIVGDDLKINLFDSQSINDLESNLDDSDLLIMGGGPLMHIAPIFMVEYAFKKAKKNGIRTAILGCGIGPLFYDKFKKSVIEIINSADLVILRDQKSKANLQNISDEYSVTIDDLNCLVSYDPAVECVLKTQDFCSADNKDYIALNLRKFPDEYSKKKLDINRKLEKFVLELAKRYKEHTIKLIPMHYFHIGGDDRLFLNKIYFDSGCDNIKVQNKPLSTFQTINVFKNAIFNLGMRFHSVIFQTISSGRNFIMDYTEPSIGKISGFIYDIDPEKFYSDRYINLQKDPINTNFIANEFDRFNFSSDRIIDKLNIYTENLQKIF